MLFLTPLHTKHYDIPKSYLMIEYKGEDNYNEQLKKIATQNPDSVCYHIVKDKQGKEIDSYIGVLCETKDVFSNYVGIPKNKIYLSLQDFESDLEKEFCKNFILDYDEKEQLKALFDTHKDGFIFID